MGTKGEWGRRGSVKVCLGVCLLMRERSGAARCLGLGRFGRLDGTIGCTCNGGGG